MLIGSKGESKLIKRNANQFDTIRVMKQVALESAKNPYFKYLINKYKLSNDKESIKRIFDYAFFNTTFKKDLPAVQQIRTGTRALREGKANCVDYSILLSSFLLNLGVPHSFRMVATEKNENFSHIYVITKDLTLDCVIGQDQEGLEKFKTFEQRKNYFNKEVPYFKKFDLKVL
jgi:hypothetical protein